MEKKILLCSSLLFFSFFVSAQTFVIRNTTVFDGDSVLENTSVLVEDGLIAEINSEITSEAKEIDGTGKFLMPAMTNSHVHAFMAFNLTEAAKAGVLNVLDMHGMETSQRTMQHIFKDSTRYARYYYAGYAATAPEGHGTQFGFPVPTLTNPEEATNFVKGRLAAGVSYIKIIEEPWKPTLSHDIVKALIDAAHVNNLKAVVHISKMKDAKTVLQNNADGLVHIWWDQQLPEEELDQLASEKSFFVIPTLLTSYTVLDFMRNSAPEGAYLSNEEIGKEVKRLYDAGIPILAGTDPPNANINYGTDIYKELALLSETGIPNLEVLKSATSNPSTYFNLNKTGFIREGYWADMLLLDENPLEDIKFINSINTIWKEGNSIKNN